MRKLRVIEVKLGEYKDLSKYGREAEAALTYKY